MSENKPMTITEFLEARIAEDEREALDAPKMSDPYDAHRTAFTDAMRRRVLAECAAKRAIIAAHRNQEDNDDDMAWIVASEVLLRALVSVYKDHPDYRQEWAL